MNHRGPSLYSHECAKKKTHTDTVAHGCLVNSIFLCVFALVYKVLQTKSCPPLPGLPTYIWLCFLFLYIFRYFTYFCMCVYFIALIRGSIILLYSLQCQQKLSILFYGDVRSKEWLSSSDSVLVFVIHCGAATRLTQC